MFQLDFQLAQKAGDMHQGTEPHTADVTQLRYDLFPGDVILRTEVCSLDAAWGWIPLLDFASAIEQICHELLSQSREEVQFTFTENDERLNFKRVGNDVAIAASYSPCKISISLEEFSGAVESFVSRLRGKVEDLFPGISQNASYRGLFSAIRSEGG